LNYGSGWNPKVRNNAPSPISNVKNALQKPVGIDDGNVRHWQCGTVIDGA